MNVNGKMISVETIAGTERERDGGEWWEDKFKYDIFYIF
jgi:hypothetical protein